MANRYLGKTIDIHSGGKDLIFPHHENEIAQSECANDAPFANYWLHNGYINVNNQKMSKSLGNFFTVRDVVKQFDYVVIRFFMLSAHYRNPINFSDELLTQAKTGLERINTCIDNLVFLSGNAPEVKAEEKALADLVSFKDAFIAAMDDDINTADAISAIFDIVKYANTNFDETTPKKVLDEAVAIIKELMGVLGILKEEKNDFLDSDIEALIEERNNARKNKDFKRADEIRDMLKDAGIALEDTRGGVKWKRV